MEQIQPLFLLLTFAVLAEAVVQNVVWTLEFFKPKDTRDTEDSWNWKRLVAFFGSVGLCAAFGIDLFNYLGYTTPVPYLASALTGVVIARGANFVNDLLTRAQPKRTVSNG